MSEKKFPKLFLAPMEGLGNRPFRKAIASIGGFDEATCEFLRVPTTGHVKSLAKRFDPKDTFPIPLAAQIMGSEPKIMGRMAQELEKRGAPRIDLNCGCPSNTVTGKGAGSSLLKTPELLHAIAKEIKNSITVPLSIKLRSGYEDTSLFQENLLACQEAGASFITLHPRTKIEGYKPPANWSLIAKAKEILVIPVVGNGDILNAEDAKRMLRETNCDALMVGRGAVINPWIFHEIKAELGLASSPFTWEKTEEYLKLFVAEIPKESAPKNQVNQLKQLIAFLFQHTEKLKALKLDLLRSSFTDIAPFLETVLPLYKLGILGC